jgi:hypothetical protein
MCNCICLIGQKYIKMIRGKVLYLVVVARHGIIGCDEQVVRRVFVECVAG